MNKIKNISHILLLFIVIFAISETKATEEFDPTLPGGINRENIEKYYEKNYEKIIENAENKIRIELIEKKINNSNFLGPIHRLLKEKPIITQVIFGTPYTISMYFIFATLMWIMVFLFTAMLSRETEMFGKYWIIAGILTTIAIANTGIIVWISKSLSHLVFSRETKTERLIILIAIVGIYWLILSLRKEIAEKITAIKTKIKEKNEKMEIKAQEKFIEGIEKAIEEKEKLKGDEEKN